MQSKESTMLIIPNPIKLITLKFVVLISLAKLVVTQFVNCPCESQSLCRINHFTNHREVRNKKNKSYCSCCLKNVWGTEILILYGTCTCCSLHDLNTKVPCRYQFVQNHFSSHSRWYFLGKHVIPLTRLMIFLWLKILLNRERWCSG